jgi:nitrate reductase gamma subunit
MTDWLEWARGPVFVFSFTLMILGLIRNFLLTIWGIIKALSRAGDKKLPWKQLLGASFSWLFPVKKFKERLWYSLSSILFHVGLIIVPVFLIEHVALWRRGLGISWPTIGQSLADGLTLMTLVMILALLIGRISSPAARALSRGQDFTLLIIIALPFFSGFLASHPLLNPFDYQATMLVHVLSGNLIMCLIPFTKLCHSVIIPLTQIVAEVGWHFPPNSGKQVRMTLGKEIDSV